MNISIWFLLEQFSFSTLTRTIVTIVFLKVFSNTAVMSDSRNMMLEKGMEVRHSWILVFTDSNYRNIVSSNFINVYSKFEN